MLSITPGVGSFALRIPDNVNELPAAFIVIVVVTLI